MKKLLRIFLASAISLALIPTYSAFAANSLSDYALDKTTVSAGGSVSIAFRVTLSEEPVVPFTFRAFVIATADENGDSWNGQQWSGQASLVSGSQSSGMWIATIQIGSNAYTGSYVVGVGLPDKSFTGASPASLYINGTTMPIPLSSIIGTMSNASTSSTTLTAGQSYDFTFDVALTSTPTSDFGFSGYIWGVPDENGDPWTEDQWSGSATLQSGNLVNGSWKVRISIPSSAITGDYLFSPAQGVSKQITSSGSLRLHIDGVAPTPAIVPFYTFSNQMLTSATVLRGNSATATFHLTSNDPQVQVPSCVIDAGGATWSRSTLISGTTLDGNWSCQANVPLDLSAGSFDFHIVVTGSGKTTKNQVRAVLPLKVVANESDLYSNTAYLTTSAVSSTSPISGDSIGASLPSQPSTSPVGRFYIPPGIGSVIFSVSGPGLVSASNFASAGRVIILNRNTSSGINAFLFSDGLLGRSTISITVSGTSISKVVNFGNLGSPSTAPSASPSPSTAPTALPSPSRTTNEVKVSPTPVATMASTPVPSSTPKPTSSTSPTKPVLPSPTSAVLGINQDLKRSYQATQLAIKRAAAKYPSINTKLMALSDSLPSPPTTVENSDQWVIQNRSIEIALSKLIASQKVTSIICVKGSLKKKVTGNNPKCPSGFRKS